MSAPTLLELAGQADEMGTPEGAAADKAAEAEQAAAVVLEDGNTQALCMILALLRTAVCDTSWVFNPPLKTPAVVLSDDELPKLCGPWAAVLTHYGVNIKDGMDHPVLVAAFATGPLLYGAVRVIGRELAERRPVDMPGKPGAPGQAAMSSEPAEPA